MFISRKLLPREQKYSTVEKECLAIKWALEELKYYVLGRYFTLVTDHAPLVWMSKNKENNGRVTRWFLSLQPYCRPQVRSCPWERGRAVPQRRPGFMDRPSPQVGAEEGVVWQLAASAPGGSN